MQYYQSITGRWVVKVEKGDPPITQTKALEMYETLKNLNQKGDDETKPQNFNSKLRSF